MADPASACNCSNLQGLEEVVEVVSFAPVPQLLVQSHHHVIADLGLLDRLQKMAVRADAHQLVVLGEQEGMGMNDLPQATWEACGLLLAENSRWQQGPLCQAQPSAGLEPEGTS